MKYTKQLLAVTGSFLLLCLMISTIVIPSLPRASAKQPETAKSSSGTSVERIEPKYTLSVADGRVAAYAGGSDSPIFISTTRVADLPAADRAALIGGIGAASRSELDRLIEEYCS